MPSAVAPRRTITGRLDRWLHLKRGATLHARAALSMGDDPDLEKRMREVERAQAVHEAVCAQRYAGITLRLNVLMGLLLALLAAGASGNPVLAAMSRLFGGH